MPERRYDDDLEQGWLLRATAHLGRDRLTVWWHGPERDRGHGASARLRDSVAVWDGPAEVRAAMAEVGWKPGQGGFVIVPLRAAKQRQAELDAERAPTQLTLTLA